MSLRVSLKKKFFFFLGGGGGGGGGRGGDSHFSLGPIEVKVWPLGQLFRPSRPLAYSLELSTMSLSLAFVARSRSIIIVTSNALNHLDEHHILTAWV